MRLNANTYPAYNILQNGQVFNLSIDEMFSTMLKTPSELRNFVQSIDVAYKMVTKRYYLTEPFKNAINKAAPKIADGNKHINEIPEGKGIIFTDNGFTIYIATPKSESTKIILFGFTRSVLTSYAVLYQNGNVGGIGASSKDGKPFNDIQHLCLYVESVLATLYFIHNCEIDTKVVQPKEKYVSADGYKYLNESSNSITVLDCRWFTELIRNIPFEVTGHFRWQPHGERNSLKKLKWISDYQKQGYTSKAKKQI